jgi:hypothetical protein
MTTLVEPVQQAADAAALMERWLDATNDALLAGDHAGVVAEVLPHGWWRDQLALSWDLRTAHGTEELTELLRNRLHAAGLRDLGVAPGKVPAFIDAGNGTEYLQAFITFHTAVGRGEGLVRLTPDEHGTWRAWTVLTALAGLDGHAERWAHGGPPEPSTAASGVPRSGPSVVSGRSRSRTASRRSSSSALGIAVLPLQLDWADWASTPSSSTPMSASRTTGASATGPSCCTTRSGTTTCPTCHIRRAGRSTRRRTSSPIGSRATPRQWNSLCGARPRSWAGPRRRDRAVDGSTSSDGTARGAISGPAISSWPPAVRVKRASPTCRASRSFAGRSSTRASTCRISATRAGARLS